VIKQGENGFMLPFDASGAEYAEIIAEIYQDDQRYAELVTSSRAAFDERLNWDAWGISVSNIIKAMLAQQNSPGASRHSPPIANSV
jgi:glycosyltransferase involved in cell wall biosynthesis